MPTSISSAPTEFSMKKEYSSTSCKVTFSLPKVAIANTTSSVVLLGDFNNWERAGIPLKANGETYYTELELEQGRDYEFRYLIDDVRWENDWNADKYVPSPYEGILNSVVSVPVTAATVATPAPAAVVEKVVEAPKPKAKKKAATAKKVAPKKAATTAKKAAPKKAAKPKKDNLKRIEGIGPKISQVLTDGGIATFKVLATSTPARIREVLIAANPKYKMYEPTTWPEQADLAAKGDWDALKQLQDQLDGGKRK